MMGRRSRDGDGAGRLGAWFWGDWTAFREVGHVCMAVGVENMIMFVILNSALSEI